MIVEVCPGCENHCDKNNLRCGRGRNYFSCQTQNSEASIEEQVMEDLRKCGHILHHAKELDQSSFLSNLSEDELETLHELLSKISI